MRSSMKIYYRDGTVAPARRERIGRSKKADPFVRMLQGGLKVEPVKETRTSLDTKDTRLMDIRSHITIRRCSQVANAIADTSCTLIWSGRRRTPPHRRFSTKACGELQTEIRNSEERLGNYARTIRYFLLTAARTLSLKSCGS